MSDVVKGIAIAAVAFVAAPLAAAYFGIALGAAGVAALNYIGYTAIMSGVAAQLASSKRPPQPSQTINYAGTVESRRIIYGDTRVGGMEIIPPVTSGTNNRMLHQVLAIAGHEVNAITAVFFGQEQVGTIGAVTGTVNDGLVSTGTFANRAWVRRYLGTSTQTADFILDSSLGIWTTDHRGRGVAYAAMQFQYDDAVYKSGKPQVTFQVQGKRVYDPRLDSTNGGSGSHRLNNPATWAYSNNPALCLADYLTDASLGMGEEQARVDWAMVAVAASECDELVAIPTATTQKRYTFNGVLYAAAPYEDNITALAGAMLGTCIYSGGRWRITAGSWPLTTEFTIDASTMADGGIDFYDAIPYNERWNSVRGSFIDPNNNYQPNEFPAVSNASYVTADGETVWRDVRFDYCTNVYEAQRLAIYLARKSRNRQSATLRCNLRAFRIRPGEVGLCTLPEVGWTNQLVRCEEWSFNAQGWIEIKVVEENSADWADPLEADYLTPLNISNPTPVDFTPDPVSSLTATPTQNGVQLTWALPSLFPSGAVVEIFEHTAITPFSSAVKIGETQGTQFVVPRTDTGVRYYWARVRMLTGAVSSVFPAVNGLAGSMSSALDFAFAVSGNVQATATGAIKLGGAVAWDSQIFSQQAFRGGAFVSFRPSATTDLMMLGLNSDPTTDANFTSLDFAMYCRNDGLLEAYESGSSAGSLGPYAGGDDLSVVYDGAVVRYMRNGAVLREVMAGPDRLFYLDSSFAGPGSVANNIRFGPYAAFGSQFIARGNAEVTGTTARKSSAVGVGFAWGDADVYSARGYVVGHLSFKASQSNADIMVGVNQDPLTDANFTSIDGALFLTSSGFLQIYQSGSLVGTYGSYTSSTVFGLAWDGGTLFYYKDGAQIHSTGYSTATTAPTYLDAAFYTPGAGVNSIDFGPGITFGVLDTPQIRSGATVDVYQTAVAPGSITGSNGSASILATLAIPAYPFAYTLVLTFTGRFSVTDTNANGVAGVWAFIAPADQLIDNTIGNAMTYTSVVSGFSVDSVGQEGQVAVAANTAVTERVYSFPSGGDTASHSGLVFKAEVLKV